MADERMKLSDLLKNGADDVTVIRAILKSSESIEKKKETFAVLREGYKVNDTTTRKIEFTEDMIKPYIEELSYQLDPKMIDTLYVACEGRHAQLRTLLSEVYKNDILAYTSADGGIDTGTNVEMFKKNLKRIRILYHNDPEERRRLVNEEKAKVSINNALSGRIIASEIAEIFPQEASEINREFNYNYVGNNGIVEDGAGFIEVGLGLSTGTHNATDENHSGINPNSQGNQVINSDSNNILNQAQRASENSIGAGGLGRTAGNSMGTITARDSMFKKYAGLVSYWDLMQVMNEVYSYYHEKNKGQSQKNNPNINDEKHAEESLKVHHVVEDFREDASDDKDTHTDAFMATVAKVDTDGSGTTKLNEEVNIDMPTNQEETKNRIESNEIKVDENSKSKVNTKANIPDADYVKMGRAVGAILSNPNGPKTLMEILTDIDNMKEYTDAARIEKYSSIKNKDEKQGGNYSEEFKVLFAWAKKIPASEIAELLESNQLFVQHEQETRNNESYESNMAAAKADMEETMEGMQKIFNPNNNGGTN